MICLNCGHDNIQGLDLCEACGSDLAGLDLPEAAGGFRGRLLGGRVDELRMAPPLAIDAGETVRRAIELMREARHGCILVREGGELAGIFTERDVLVRVMRRGLDPDRVRVGEVMTPEPLVLEPGDPPAFAVYRMVAQSLRHIPVVSGNDPVGFISVRSVLRYLEDRVIGRGGAAGSEA